MKNPLSQERKSCSPIALPFDELQLSHMPFDRSITPLPGETISHGVFVFLDASGKGLEFGKLAAFHLGQPGIEEFSRPCAQHSRKLLNQVISQIDFRMDLTECDECLLLLGTEFFRAVR